jgi:Tfp pilus assembly protein PilW
MFGKKSISLIELIIAMVLLGVMILAIYGFHSASRNLFSASETKSEILNELNYVLNHIEKSIYMATGWQGRPAVEIITGSPDYTVKIYQDLNSGVTNPTEIGNPLNTPGKFDDDRIVTYSFDINNNTIVYEVNDNNPLTPASVTRTLTNRLISVDLSYVKDSSGNNIFGTLQINDLTLRYDPGKNPHFETNPEITISDQVFIPPAQSLN